MYYFELKGFMPVILLQAQGVLLHAIKFDTCLLTKYHVKSAFCSYCCILLSLTLACWQTTMSNGLHGIVWRSSGTQCSASAALELCIDSISRCRLTPIRNSVFCANAQDLSIDSISWYLLTPIQNSVLCALLENWVLIQFQVIAWHRPAIPFRVSIEPML